MLSLITKLRYKSHQNVNLDTDTLEVVSHLKLSTRLILYALLYSVYNLQGGVVTAKSLISLSLSVNNCKDCSRMSTLWLKNSRTWCALWSMSKQVILTCDLGLMRKDISILKHIGLCIKERITPQMHWNFEQSQLYLQIVQTTKLL